MNQDKIKMREKLSFAMANFGNIPVMTLINGYLLIFYTNICGLSPAACATLFLIARFLDAINDPLVGFMIDHLPTRKMGHFRPTLILGTILCSANFLLLWFGPINIGETGNRICIVYSAWCVFPSHGYFAEQSSAGYDRRYERKEQLKFNQRACIRDRGACNRCGSSTYSWRYF